MSYTPSLLVITFSLLLAACSHQPVSVSQLQQAEAVLETTPTLVFTWSWLEGANNEQQQTFERWLLQQSPSTLLACLCVSAEEPASKTLYEGWRAVQHVKAIAGQRGFHMTIELKTHLGASALLIKGLNDGVSYGE